MQGINWDSVLHSALMGGIIGAAIGLLYMIVRTILKYGFRWVRTGSLRAKK